MSQKPAYGIAGWTKDDHSVIVYDAYDLWELFPDGAAKPRRLTDGAAKRSATATRALRRSPAGVAAGGAAAAATTRSGSTSTSLCISAWRAAGPSAPAMRGCRTERRNGWCSNKGVRGLEKAKNADTLVYQAGAWNQSPNYFTAGPDLKSPQKASDTNPFAAQYAWGRAELVDYKNSHGDRLQGALYYPANYESGKQYPMIVQIYEIVSTSFITGPRPANAPLTTPRCGPRTVTSCIGPDIIFSPRDAGAFGVGLRDLRR